MGPIFFSPGDSHKKGLLFLLHLGLEGITEVDTDLKLGFVSLKVTPLALITEFSVFMPLQGIAPGNSCLGDKMGRHSENKTERLYRCCYNYSLIVDDGLRIYREGRTQIPLSSPAMIGPLARIQDRQGLYWYKNC